MELGEYREYLRRIEEADSVRTLHRIATEAQLAHPRDTDAASVERACFARAESLIALGRFTRQGDSLARSASPLDWRARAAGDE
jgi:hypothetical protein